MMKYGSTNVIVEEFSWICTFPFRICSIILKICENVFMVKVVVNGRVTVKIKGRGQKIIELVSLKCIDTRNFKKIEQHLYYWTKSYCCMFTGFLAYLRNLWVTNVHTFWHCRIQHRSQVRSIKSSEVSTLNSITCSAQVPKNFKEITSVSRLPIRAGLILFTNCKNYKFIGIVQKQSSHWGFS